MKNKKIFEINQDLEKDEFITEREALRQPKTAKVRRDDKVRVWGFKENFKRSRG